MKWKYMMYVGALFLFSCQEESYDVVAPVPFNKVIRADSAINNAEMLVRRFYEYNHDTTFKEVDVVSKSLGNNRFFIKSTCQKKYTNLVSAEKITMKAERFSDHWRVQQIKRNWKCKEGHGHSSWGCEPCK